MTHPRPPRSPGFETASGLVHAAPSRALPDIARLLRERPQVIGLAVPGMVAGSPGMEQGQPQH